MKVESFHEFYRTIELIHKRRSYNEHETNEQLNPLFDCDSYDEPEYKTILIPTPIVIVERLPEILENNNDEIITAENIPQDLDAFQTPKKRDAKGPKSRKISRSKSPKSTEKKRTKKSPKTIRTIEKFV